MLRIAICDDERRAREQLCACLERFAREQSYEVEILEYASADALLRDYPANLDLLLLDIYMAGVDGMAAAHSIRGFDPAVCIIFITTMYQRAIEGYAVRAFGFIRKPVSYAELSHELGCAAKQIMYSKDSKHYIAVRSGGTAYRLPVEHIEYCEVRNHSVYISAGGELSEYRCSMKELDERLAPYGFFRCHASFLVNSQCIGRIDTASLTLHSGTQLPISQRRRKEFLAELARYMGERI